MCSTTTSTIASMPSPGGVWCGARASTIQTRSAASALSARTRWMTRPTMAPARNGGCSSMSTSEQRRGPLTRSSASAWLALAAVGVLIAARPAGAQTSLGGQRAGTSSATFLRIGVGARAVGMGETFVAVANDPSAIYWNPAGLGSLLRRELAISHVQWPADVHYDHLTLLLPSRRLGGSLAMQFAVL